jgi:carboxyl-terminal processing protease
MEDTKGDFGGIGAQLDVNEKKQVYIDEPMENSPAARKGVQRGDIILAVDGRLVQGLSTGAVVSRIRGKEGTNVRLTLQRGARTFDLVIQRAIIHSPIVKARMQDAAAGVGYIALAQFNEQADEQFQRQLSQLEKKGMKALIFDLRGNPGGLLNIAQDLASRFIPSGKIVIVQERNGRESSLDVETRKHQSRALVSGKYPVVILVNGGSASASEIVSGAIKDHRVGTLIGTTTYGKGLVQTIIPVSGDAAVKVTTQRYFTPNHLDINKKLDESGKQIGGGITPDIEVKITDEDTERMQKAYKANPNDASHDPQLNKAVSVLKDQLAGKLPRPVATGDAAGAAQTARR